MASVAPSGFAAHTSADIQVKLLGWYDRHARRLPWRAPPGAALQDPYRVWLSEIMLQQTTVATVGPYYQGFLARWPDVDALAAAPLDQVLTAWAGLGYYARARNLHRCAQVVSEDLQGVFPDNEADLLKLPGIGAYTAAAVAAIAFGRRAVVVDGNVERVVARLFAVETPLPAAKAELKALTDTITPGRRAGDFAQAMMDLGATVCLPRQPKCLLCPLETHCRGRAAGSAADLPRRLPKKVKPTRHAVAFWLAGPEGALLLRRRPEKGLLGGMMEVPSTDWRDSRWQESEAVKAVPLAADWQALPGMVRHTFTHFHFEVTVWAAMTTRARLPKTAGRWVALDGLDGEALPTVMRKIIDHGLKQTADLRPASDG
ncbi:A/G-specific adenine glycosylase [Pelagibius litoralis]|uniref:Adenine DNA glycosylase n=1 Tax=Pelagibius litoralis TaxID=374515 RepID=A0A967F206_9PROT|nr:A/G-specific adenine glycosylase [Pelagibius litoralis]NIA71587.1 A/G-specific adenine glycosylase [Pelagibius litoralis]